MTANLERQRATGIDDAQREQQLHGFVQPLIQEWQSPELSTALNSFSGFCDLLGLNGLSQYFESRNLHQVSDWPGYPLDEEGKVLQAQIQNALEVRPYHLVLSSCTKVGEETSPTPDKDPYECEYREGAIWFSCSQSRLRPMVKCTTCSPAKSPSAH